MRGSPISPNPVAADEEAAAAALLSVGLATTATMHRTPQQTQKPGTSVKRGLNLDAHQDSDSDPPALALLSTRLPEMSAARSVTKKRKVAGAEPQHRQQPQHRHLPSAVGYKASHQKAAVHPPAIALLQREIEAAYPMDVLKLPRKQWNQWREQNTPPLLTDAALKYLTTYRRLCLARLYSEKSRQMKRHSTEDLKVTVKALRKENADLRKRLLRYEPHVDPGAVTSEIEGSVVEHDTITDDGSFSQV